MIFQTVGNIENPAVLFFHAMGVTGKSSSPVAEHLKDRYYCIMPTSTVYCAGQNYISKADELRQLEAYLVEQRITELALVASSLGADLACAFLAETKLPVHHVFFDGGQFARIGKVTRHIMAPFLYLAIKSLYWSKGGTLKKICGAMTMTSSLFHRRWKSPDVQSSAPPDAVQSGGQAVPRIPGRTARAYIFRVRQHRGAFQIPGCCDESLSPRSFPRVSEFQPYAVSDQRSQGLCGNAGCLQKIPRYRDNGSSTSNLYSMQ